MASEFYSRQQGNETLRNLSKYSTALETYCSDQIKKTHYSWGWDYSMLLCFHDEAGLHGVIKVALRNVNIDQRNFTDNALVVHYVWYIDKAYTS